MCDPLAYMGSALVGSGGKSGGPCPTMGDQGFDLRCNGRQGRQGKRQPSDLGRSIWGTTHVVEDYTDEVCVAEMTGGDDFARKETENRKRRQQAWADRQPNSTAKEWRPTKRPRVSSYNFIRYIDNQATLVITLWRDLPWGSGGKQAVAEFLCFGLCGATSWLSTYGFPYG